MNTAKVKVAATLLLCALLCACDQRAPSVQESTPVVPHTTYNMEGVGSSGRMLRIDTSGAEALPYAEQSQAWQSSVDQLVRISNKVMEAPNANYKFDACFLQDDDCVAHSSAYRDVFRGVTYYYAPSRQSIAKNNVLFYLSLKDGQRPQIVMRVIYFGEDWLYLKHISLLADGKVVYQQDISPDQSQRQAVTGSQLYEFGDILMIDNRDVIEQIANAGAVALKMSGKGGEAYLDERMLVNMQLQAGEILLMYDLLENAIGQPASDLTI